MEMKTLELTRRQTKQLVPNLALRQAFPCTLGRRLADLATRQHVNHPLKNKFDICE